MDAADPHRNQAPSSLLLENLSWLPKGKALDVAMGYGRNAFYLAANGYEVEGVDLSEEAVSFCREEAKRRGLPLDVHRVDLESHRLKPGAYELIACFYYLDRNLFPQIQSALKKGGMLVYETFLIDQHTRYGKPTRVEFCLARNELLAAFSDLRVRLYQEGEIEGTFIARLIAEKAS
jgi:SAM-dependent methyltransferase